MEQAQKHLYGTRLAVGLVFGHLTGGTTSGALVSADGSIVMGVNGTTTHWVRGV